MAKEEFEQVDFRGWVTRPDKHISVQPELHERLKKLAEKQGRSMRAVLERLISEAEKSEE